MNKSVIFTVLAACLFAACTSTPKSYTVEGVVPDDSYNNKMVYLLDIVTRQPMDSALVADGKFTFTGSADTAVICRLMLERLNVNLILENGKISVDMAVPESAKGTPLNDELSKFETERAVFGKTFSEKQRELRKNQDIDFEAARQKILDEYTAKSDSVCAIFFHANKNNVVGAFVLWNWSNFLESDRFDSLCEEAGDVVRNFKPIQNIINVNARIKQTAEGMPFTDFTIENGNLDGSKASFSDYVGKGKYVLVDFWASWCGPCMAEIPVLVEVYNKYKGDKFDLLGVAVWDKREETLKSIESKNIAWSQIIDAGSIPTDLYGIRGIPHIILFAPDGTIVARNLRGDGLKAKVAEVMQ
jgi:thiol-disulfide isomerase/thioredoxin